MTITELYEKEQSYWKLQNIKLFGIEPIDESWDFDKIQASIDESCSKYWNSSQVCKLARYINNGTLDHEANIKIPNSFKLQLNALNMCVDILADYNKNNKVATYKIGAIPTPSIDLTWIINRSHYVTRVTATRDYYHIIGKVSFDMVSGEGWNYNLSTDTFTCTAKKNPFEPTIEEIFNNHVSSRSRYLLQSCLDEDEVLSINNFKFALKMLPIFDNASIYNYTFRRLEYFEDIILNSGKYAQPTKHILLGINQMIVSQSRTYTTTNEYYEGCVVRSESPIFALENFRTVVNIYHSDFKPPFCFTDIEGFFDSFKTVTSGAAGRQRLLIDDIVVHNGMLFRRNEDGTEDDMYKLRFEHPTNRISCLSAAMFGNNDKPKRIMMNAKLTSQAVSLADEQDPITHRIKARVGFADLEGYTYGDSIVISESFAKRLRTYSKDIIYIKSTEKDYKDLITNCEKTLPYYLTFDDLKLIYPKTHPAILDSYDRARIIKIENTNYDVLRLFVEWEIPFGLGDKITNLHGAKGTVGKILPDKEMPTLVECAGNMPAGPLEVIVSGFSTMRRGSLGQIFEAWANASGIPFKPGEDFISNAINKYQAQMQEFAKHSIVKYKHQKITMPIGIIDFMRVYHHASIHISDSPANSDYNKTLKLGEMEKFNLVSSGCVNILKELSIRSMHKYIGSSKLVEDIEATRELPENPKLNLKFASLLKSIGYDIRLNNKSIIGSDFHSVELNEEDINKFNAIETDLNIKGDV